MTVTADVVLQPFNTKPKPYYLIVAELSVAQRRMREMLKLRLGFWGSVVSSSSGDPAANAFECISS